MPQLPLVIGIAFGTLSEVNSQPLIVGFDMATFIHTHPMHIPRALLKGVYVST